MAKVHGSQLMAASPVDGPESIRDWGSLDPDLLVRIMTLLWPTQREPSRLMLQAMMRACGVCQHWRSMGNALFFSNNSWQGQATIRHPKQLVTLCPPAQAPSGLIRGQVRREYSSRWGLAGRRQRLVLYQGIQSARGQIELCGKFLLAAEQRANGAWALFLDRKCKGRPVARLSCNSLRTTYTLTAAAGGAYAGAGLQGCRSSSCGGLQQSNSSTSYLSSISSSSSGSGSLYSSASADNSRVVSSKDPQQQPKQSRCFSWPHQCVMGCEGLACMPPETLGAVVPVGVPGGSAAEASTAAAAAAGPSAVSGVSPQVLMSLQYKLHLKAMVLPRRMSVMLHIPQQLQQQCALSTRAGSSSSSSSSSVWQSPKDAHPAPQAHLVSRPEAQQPAQHSTAQQLSLENKLPRWNDALRVWCLNFGGRVRLSSAKNFQLVSAVTDTAQQQPLPQVQPWPEDAAADADAAAAAGAGGADAATPAAVLGNSVSTSGVIMQFGKTDVDAFILDYNPSITTALQAMAVACTTFGTKLLA